MATGLGELRELRLLVGQLRDYTDSQVDEFGRPYASDLAPERLSAERRTRIYPEYANDPAGFVRDVLGEDTNADDVLAGRALTANAPWSKQTEIMESVRDHERTHVRACHSVGKTHGAARVGLWFLYTRSPAIVMTTAPKATQVRDLLWGRWRSAWSQARRPLSGRCLTTRCIPLATDSEWYAVGHTARDANAFSGYHEAHVLIILDEAPGVPSWIWEATEGMLSSANTRILAIGNPLRRSGAYYQASRDDAWHRIHISAYEHPNVTLGRSVYQSAVKPSWPAERLASWGPKHPLYLSRVMGQFPDDADDTLIPLSWIEAAVDREVSLEGPTALGVDVARFGLNETVLFLVQGRKATMLEAYVGKDTVETEGRIIRWLPMVERVGIDDVGVGGGVVDHVKRAPGGALKVLRFEAGGSARAKDDFADLGTEAMWALREACRASFEHPDDPAVGMSLPNDEELIAQLVGREYDILERSVIKMRSKRQLRAEGEPSPDRADSLAIAWWAAHRKPPRINLGRVYG